MCLAYISQKKNPTLKYTRKAKEILLIYLLLHQSQKKDQPNQPPPAPHFKLYKISNFPITNKINLPDKTKAPEKNLVATLGNKRDGRL